MSFLATLWCLFATIALLIVVPAAIIQLCFAFVGLTITAPWAVAMWLGSVLFTVLVVSG